MKLTSDELSSIIGEALEEIPTVIGRKEKKEVRGQPEVVEKVLIRDIPLREIIKRLKSKYQKIDDLEYLLASSFIIWFSSNYCGKVT